jgi:hypothetical protein
MVCSGILVDVEKVDLAEFMKRYPQAFSRPTHPDVGPYYDTWVIG